MPIRVALWDTTGLGAYAARAIVAHPELELVGAHVPLPELAGRDVADLVDGAGWPALAPTGVRATADVEDLLALDADCVVHCPPQERDPDGVVDDVCRVLAAGTSVSSTALMHLIHPNAMPEERRRRIEAACDAGRSTFHATGINPGFFSDVLPSLLSSVTSDIRTIVATEFHSYAGNPDRWIVVDHVGMGGTLEAKAAKIVDRAARFGRAPLEVLAQAVGLRVDDVTFDYDLHAADDDLEIAATTIPKGSFAGSWYRFGAVVDGVERLRLEFIHRAAPHVAPEWPQAPAVPTCFRVEIDAVPRVVSETAIAVDHGLPTYAGAGIHVVNAVPAVVAADPGIRTRLDLAPFGGRAVPPGRPSAWREGRS